MICQQYVSKPFLIDGFKFDLRIYIVVSSCDPLRIFVYKDGLARFATVQYNEPSNGNLVRLYETRRKIFQTLSEWLKLANGCCF